MTTIKEKGNKSQTYTASGHKDESNEDLAKRYLPLVKSIVGKMRMHLPPSIEPEDVYGIGVYGLMSALSNFDRSKGTAFGAYACLRIRGAILDELRRLDWMPRKMRANARRFNLIRQELEQELGRLPEDEEMAEALDMPLIEYRIMHEQMKPISIVNLDAVFGDEEGGESLQNVIADLTHLDARERMEGQERVNGIKKIISEMDDIPKKVLAMYYYENMRLAEISKVFGLSESRICQIHSKAIQSIRDTIREAN